MNLVNRSRLPAWVGMLLVVGFISSCEQELTTIGEGVIGGEPFVTDKETYDVFVYNRKIEAVQTNQLPIYQLGVFNDLVYGKTEASITSQLQLSTINPEFGAMSASEEISDAFDELERIDSVLIYIPYLNDMTDTDNDGVVDILDTAPEDPTNDSDGDGVPNNEEAANTSDPLNPDTDGDGMNDNVDESTLGGRFARRFKLDSIYGDRSAPFNFKIERSTFFLRDLDPSTNFQESQEFFSTQEFSPAFTEEVFFDDQVTISDEQILFIVQEDDPDTEDVNEQGTVSSTLDPGIFVKLNTTAETFFQNNFLDREGGSELLSDSNFKEFIRGIHISVEPTTEELLMILNINNARMDIYYTYDEENDDGSREEVQDIFQLNLLVNAGTAFRGNAVNTFINEAYPAEITNALDTGENASRIYLKGGAGAFAEVKLFSDDVDTADSIIDEIRANNWIINEASLVFYVDSDIVPADANRPPRLYLYNGETNEPLFNILTENNVEDSALGVFLNYDGILDDSDEQNIRYTVNITEHINNLVVRDSTNATLGLMITPDIRLSNANNAMLSQGVEQEIPAAGVLTPFSTVLFGNNVPDEDNKKLTLEIFYTETNQ